MTAHGRGRNRLEPQTPAATRRSRAMDLGAKLREPRPACAPARRASLIHGLWFLVLVIAYVLTSPHPVLAAADWILLCPQGGTGEPQYQDQRGVVFPIINPGERAIAHKVCNPNFSQGAINVAVSVTNSGANTIYVAFTNYLTQMPGQITWTNCTVVNYQVTIPAGNTTCNASVPSTAGMTRFCAFTSQVPTGKSPNCNLAQAHNQTIIETNFGTGSNGVCFPATLSSCVWYDISVIPQNCTPAAWTLNTCQNTGGASYNLPVSLASNGEPTYTCAGPPSGTPYGNANYPSNCGNPVANCVGNVPTCNNAYFFPTPSPSPNSEAHLGSH
jgi:hypothetical protein